MTTVISIASGKGGVTKSTIARALGVAYTKGEWNVICYDMDIGQSTLANWMRRRISYAVEPIFDVQSVGDPARVKKSIEAGPWDLAIIDCAAFASKSTVAIAELSDMVVIPTRTSLDDMESAITTANDLIKAGTPIDKIAIAFSGVAENQRDYDQACEYVGKTPYYLIPGYIPSKPALSNAQDLGRSIIECSYKGPQEKADYVIQGIIDRLQVLTS